jgi:hypothetical protein
MGQSTSGSSQAKAAVTRAQSALTTRRTYQRPTTPRPSAILPVCRYIAGYPSRPHLRAGMKLYVVNERMLWVDQALCTQDAYSLMSFDGANRSTLFYASANERTDCCEFLIDW